MKFRQNCFFFLLLLFCLTATGRSASIQTDFAIRSVPIVVNKKWFETMNPAGPQYVEINKNEYGKLLKKKEEELRQFLEMKEAQKSLAYSIRSVKVEAQQTGDKLLIKQLIDSSVSCHKKYQGPILVPLQLGKLAVKIIKVKGASVNCKVFSPFDPNDRYQYIELEKPGNHLIEVIGELPISSTGNSMRCKIPFVKSTIQKVDLHFATRERMRVITESGTVSVKRKDDGSRSYRLNCSGLSSVAVSWFPQAPPKKKVMAPPRLVTTMHSEYVINIGDIVSTHRLSIVNTGGPTRRLTLALPLGTTVDRLNGKDVDGHKSVLTTRGRALAIQFKRPIKGATFIEIVCSREGLTPTEKKQQVTLNVPYAYSAIRKQGLVEFSTPFSATLSAKKLSAVYRPTRKLDKVELRYHCSDSTLPKVTLEVDRQTKLATLGAWAASCNSITVLSHSHSPSEEESKSLTAITKLVLQVLNSNQDFFTFTLPADTELYECLVDGAAFTPTILKSNEQGKVYRLRLLKSLRYEGLLMTYSIALTYRQKIGSPLKSYGQFQCTQPSFSIPVSNLSWEVVLPDGHMVTSTTGSTVRKCKECDFFPITLMNNFGDLFEEAGTMEKQKKAHCKQTIDIIRNALNLHDAQNRPLTGTSLEPLLGRYLQELPNCPYGVSYRLSATKRVICPHCTENPDAWLGPLHARVGHTIKASTGKKITFKTDSFRMPRTGQSLFFSKPYLTPGEKANFAAHHIARWLQWLFGVLTMLLAGIVTYLIRKALSSLSLVYYLAGGFSLFLITAFFVDEASPSLCKLFILGGFMFAFAYVLTDYIHKHWLVAAVVIITLSTLSHRNAKAMTLRPLHLPHCQEVKSSYFLSFKQWDDLTTALKPPEAVQPVEGSSSSICTATLHENHLHVDLNAKLQLTKKKQRSLLLMRDIERASVCSASVDGLPINLDINTHRQLLWDTKLKGEHTLKLSLDIPFEQPASDSFSLRIPVIRSALGVLNFQTAITNGKWSLHQGVLKQNKPGNYSGHYSPTDAVFVTFKRKAPLHVDEKVQETVTAPDATFVHQVDILNEEYAHRLALQLKNRPRNNRRISLLIPKGVDVTSVDAPNASVDWRKDRVILHLETGYKKDANIVVNLSSKAEGGRLSILLPTLEYCRNEEHFTAVKVSDGLSVKLMNQHPVLREIRANKIPKCALNFGTQTFSKCVTARIRRDQIKHNKPFIHMTYKFANLETAKTWAGMARLVEATTYISATGSEVTKVNYFLNDWQSPYIAVQLPKDCQIVSVAQVQNDVNDVIAKNNAGKNEVLLPVDRSTAKRTSLTYRRATSALKTNGKLTLVLPNTEIAIANVRWTIYTPNEFTLAPEDGTVRVDSKFRPVGHRNNPSELGMRVIKKTGFTVKYLSTELVGPHDLPPTISFTVAAAEPQRGYRKLLFIITFILLLAILVFPKNWQITAALSLPTVIISLVLFHGSPVSSLYRGVYLALLTAPVVATILSIVDEAGSVEPSEVNETTQTADSSPDPCTAVGA